MRHLTLLAICAAALALAGCGGHPIRTKEYVYPAWGFKASFNVPPETKDTPAAADGTPHSFLAEAHTPNHDFVVTAFDAAPGHDLDSFGDSASASLAKAMGGVVQGQTYVATFEDLMGREYRIDKAGKPFATLRVFNVGDRFYEVLAVSIYGPSDPAVSDFLYSFHALDAKGDVTNGLSPTAPASNGPAPPS